jgi:GxxExxY protein
LAEKDLLYSDMTRQIIGAAMEVHRVLGHGFLENVYEEALAHELTLHNIKFQRQVAFDVIYKGKKVKHYICDFIVDNKIIVEIKALGRLTETEWSQLINYLKATNHNVGLIFNFGSASLEHKRLIKSHP